MQKQTVIVKSRKHINIVSDVEEATPVGVFVESYSDVERFKSVNNFVHGIIVKSLADSKLALVDEKFYHEAVDIIAVTEDVTVALEISDNKGLTLPVNEISIDEELLERYPRKYLLLQNQEVVLIEETLDDIWSKLPEYIASRQAGKIRIISPKVRTKMKRKLGWRIKRRY